MIALPALIGVALAGLPAAAQAQSDDPDREQLLWAQIVALQQPPTTTQPFTARLDSELARRRALLERVQLYLTLYPGGVRRDQAASVELRTLFEIGALSGGEFTALRARVEAHLRNPPSEAAVHEAAYWKIICDHAARGPATQPTSRTLERLGEHLRADYERYLATYPASSHAPRVGTLLFEDAVQREDRAMQRRIVAWLSASFPEHAVTATLAGQLRQAEAVGQAFGLRFEQEDGGVIDTREWVGRPVVIVVWAGAEAAARQRVQEVETFRRAQPDLRVVGVNLDETSDIARAACRELGIDWPQFNDGLGWANRFAREWGVRRVPLLFVVDRAGRLLGVRSGADWQELAQRALAGSI